jgi:transposase
MPWKLTNVMEQRIEFIVRALVGGSSFTELCHSCGISRRTGYKWFRRYMEAGSFNAVHELSRKPHNSPAKSSSELEARVIELRQRYGWGGKKLGELLRREGLRVSVRTIDRIIKRNGLIRAKDTSSKQATKKRFERAAANDLW